MKEDQSCKLRMEKGFQGRLVLLATQIIFSLVLFHLLYIELSGFKAAAPTSYRIIWVQNLSNTKVSNYPSNRRVIEDGAGERHNHSLGFLLTRLVAGEDRNKLETTGFACDINYSSKVCVSNKPIKIDTGKMNVHLQPPYLNQTLPPGETIVHPYARQEDKELLKYITPVKILGNTVTAQSLPCEHNHSVPAVIFSAGGFTGNLFHEVNEIIIPLFITSRIFQSRVRFILVDYKPFIVKRYNHIFSRLSSHEIIDPTAGNSSVHCFPGMAVGLKFHSFLGVNSTDNPKGYYSMPDFRQFLRETYKLKVRNVWEMKNPPVLMLISRPKTRKFLNEGEMVKMMEELGFKVIVAQPKQMSSLEKFSKIVNSCSIMVGVHGAGLTNELFLPDGAVMIQVRPLGLEWASRAYFGEPAAGMRVNYLEYKIEPEESSLVQLYGRDSPEVVDPGSIFAKGYQAARAVYVDRQDMNINVYRFKETLIEALGLIGPHSRKPQ